MKLTGVYVSLNICEIVFLAKQLEKETEFY